MLTPLQDDSFGSADAEKIDLSTWDINDLISVVGTLQEQVRDMKEDLAFYLGDLSRRMKRNEQRALIHPLFEVKRDPKNEYSWSSDDCDLFIARAREIGVPEPDIAVAMKRDEVIEYTTKYSSVMALAKLHGKPLLEIADRVVKAEKPDYISVKPKKQPTLRSVPGHTAS